MRDPILASVGSVAIDGGDRTLIVGDMVDLDATVVASGGASTTVAWSSGAESVATVDAAGVVTGLTEGVAQITATSTFDPSESDTITLTVVEPGTLGWTRQFGTSGNVFVTGYTDSAIVGTSAGRSDAFVRKYSR